MSVKSLCNLEDVCGEENTSRRILEEAKLAQLEVGSHRESLRDPCCLDVSTIKWRTAPFDFTQTSLIGASREAQLQVLKRLKPDEQRALIIEKKQPQQTGTKPLRTCPLPASQPDSSPSPAL